MERKGMARFAPLAGVLFLILGAAAILTAGDPPDADAPTGEVVEFYADKETENLISAILTVYAALMVVWFAGSLREAIARVEERGSRLASIAFGGGTILAVGLAFNAAFQVIAADIADDVPGTVTQTIHVLYDGTYFPLGLGIGTLLLASGLAAVRHGAFDRWLGWIAIVLGVLCFTPAGFAGFLGGIVWCAIAGILLYRKKDPAAAGGTPPPTGPETPPASPTAPI